MNALIELQRWYEKNCDGDWEHQFGVQIETLDNPGWVLRIDLSGTRLEHCSLEFPDIERTEFDWVHCRVTEERFEAAGGPRNLEEMLRIFLTWAKSAEA